MLLALLDLSDRVTEMGDRLRRARPEWIVGALLIVLCIAFLLLESLWETITPRSTRSTTTADGVLPEA